MVNGELNALKDSLENFLKGQIGKPVLLINSDFQRAGSEPGCFGGGYYPVRRDVLNLGVLSGDRVSEGERESPVKVFPRSGGLIIPTGDHLSYDPHGYSTGALNSGQKLWVKEKGDILFRPSSFWNLGPEGEQYCPKDSFVPMLLVGDQVSEFFTRGGDRKEIKSDYYLDPSFVYGLKLLGREDLAPEKFVRAYDEFTARVTTEVVEALQGKEKMKNYRLYEEAVVAGLESTELVIPGKLPGDRIVVAEALPRLKK